MSTPLVDQLKAISDETRLKILTMLLHKNYCVRAIAEQLQISNSAVSQHLKILRKAGLVVGKKRSYWMHYSVQRDQLDQIGDQIKNLRELFPEINYEKIGCCNKSHIFKQMNIEEEDER